MTTATFDKVAYAAKVRPAGGGDGVCRRSWRSLLVGSATAGRLLLILMMLPSVVMAQETAQKTVVLIHGAFADGSSWDKVIPILQAKGLKVVAVQNPLTSLGDDVAAGKRVIDAQSGPVILVGHSWGGTVITELAAHPSMERIG